MATEADRNRAETLDSMRRDFLPPHRRDSSVTPEVRLANAAEYAAHHIGKISRNLDRLVALLEKQQNER